MEKKLLSDGETPDPLYLRGEHFVMSPDTGSFTAETPKGPVTIVRGQCLRFGDQCRGCLRGMNSHGDAHVINRGAAFETIGSEALNKRVELGLVSVGDCECDAQARYDAKHQPKE